MIPPPSLRWVREDGQITTERVAFGTSPQGILWHFAADCKGRLRLLRGEALALHGQALWPGSCLPRAEDGTLYHLLATDGAAESGGRRGPVDPYLDDELVAHIQHLLEAPPFPGDGFAAGTHFTPHPAFLYTNDS